MAELEFSIMAHGANSEEAIRPLLDQFEAEYKIKVKVTVLPWRWNDTLRIALLRAGPDVSEVGSTWVSSLAAMDAIQTFSHAEIHALGGAEAFLEAAWQSCKLDKNPEVWAIPWTTDVRALYFWHNLLIQAGISDPHSAFADFETMTCALEALRAAGMATPWATNIDRSSQLIHAAASWIWGAGGQLLSEDGKRVLFDQPEAKLGLRRYFGLHRFFDLREASITSPWDLFDRAQIAAVFGGPWVYSGARDTRPAALDNLGMQPGPVVPFVGGSNLVIWKHSLRHSAAQKLIQFLTNRPAAIPFSAHAAHLPSRKAALAELQQRGTPHERSLVEIVKRGRSLPSSRLWGLVEENAINMLANIWDQLLRNPALDLDEVIEAEVMPTAHRLNMVLGN